MTQREDRMSTEIDTLSVDILVIGSGIAGCAAALNASQTNADVLLVTKASRPAEITTDWAQGGIATTRIDPDTFKQDIIETSSQTADAKAVDVLVDNAPEAIEEVLIETLDISFDKRPDGEFSYGLEGGHSQRRVLHIDASTGKYILRPFLDHLESVSNVEILDDTASLDLLTSDGAVQGAVVERNSNLKAVYAGATILATGGIGALYSRTSNPRGNTGDGIAMAALAGADIIDMEFVQFHPTAFDPNAIEPNDADSFLISEAVRGEGAALHNGDGERFMPTYHPQAELAPRDVVARAIATERERTGNVWLHTASIEFEEKFPTLYEQCLNRGADPAEKIPVSPCQHFLCGGIDVDVYGRTSLDALYAVGECSHTGVHGANRLASTSLLEGLVWGLRAGTDALTHINEQTESIATHELAEMNPPAYLDRDPPLPESFAHEKFVRLRRIMDSNVGLYRNRKSLDRAAGMLRRLKGEVDAYIRTRTSRSLYELRNATITGILITRAAREREQSVGCHYIESNPNDESKITTQEANSTHGA